MWTPRLLFAGAVLASAALDGSAMPLLEPALGQQQPPASATRALAFDVASIRSSAPATPESFGWTITGFAAAGTTLDWVIMSAYLTLPEAEWRHDRVQGGPAWLRDDRYDIQAKVDDATATELARPDSPEQQARLRSMLQALLMERCGLRVHTVLVNGDVLALTLPHGARELTPSAKGQRPAAGVDVGDGGFMVPVQVDGRRAFRLYNVTMAKFAEILSGLGTGSQPVIRDHTGLSGRYDFVLKRRDAEPTGGAGISTPGMASGWDVEALRFALRPSKDPLQTLVVDHMDRPSAN